MNIDTNTFQKLHFEAIEGFQKNLLELVEEDIRERFLSKTEKPIFDSTGQKNTLGL